MNIGKRKLTKANRCAPSNPNGKVSRNASPRRSSRSASHWHRKISGSVQPRRPPRSQRRRRRSLTSWALPPVQGVMTFKGRRGRRRSTPMPCSGLPKRLCSETSTACKFSISARRPGFSERMAASSWKPKARTAGRGSSTSSTLSGSSPPAISCRVPRWPAASAALCLGRPLQERTRKTVAPSLSG